MIGDFSLDRNHPLGLARQIADRLTSGVSSGELAAGEKLPSERELVRLFQVSKDTIRKALSILVERGLVIKSPSRGSFVASAELLADNRDRRHVHVFLSLGEDNPWEGLICGLSLELQRQGLEVLLKNMSGWRPNDCRRALRLSIKETPAGLIIYPQFLERLSAFYRSLSESGTPTVLVDAGIHVGINAVVVDEAEGISLAVRHLYALGHRRIGYVPGPNGISCEHNQRRVEAFLRICAELGLSRAEDRICCAEGAAPGRWERPASSYQKRIRCFVQSSDAPTALICFNDMVAMIVWSAAESAGRTVPDDLSIVGFDNNRAAESWTRPLTTIDPKMTHMGKLAARRLVRLIDGNGINKQVVTYAQPKLVDRQSTATPRRVTS